MPKFAVIATDIFAGCTKVESAPLPRAVVIYSVPDPSDAFVAGVANKLKNHYITAKLLQKWGNKKLAAFLLKKTPATLVGKSGDLGEILATEMVNAGYLGSYRIPINRLRWKDSQELPMRGDDLIGISFDESPIKFLKGEAKSRSKLSSSVLTKARNALEKNKGLPLSHTLGFVVERLYEVGEDARADLLEPYLLEKVPTQSQVAHMVFTFSGNDPSKLLTDEIKDAKTISSKLSWHFYIRSRRCH